ncbi:MAG TPA: hypothetical protein VF723_12000 [Pyrinomonadaceae bacterium]|jgi:hypothetical protein
MRKGRNVWRGVFSALGFIGTLISFSGLLLMLSRTSVALPGIGLIVGGEVIMLIGILIIAGAIAVDATVFGERLP